MPFGHLHAKMTEDLPPPPQSDVTSSMDEVR